MKAHRTTKSIAVMMVIVSLVLGSATMNIAAAADKTPPVKATADKQQLNIQYAGELDGYVYLRINMVQASAEKSSLKIFDLSGEKLYEETVGAKEFTRVIKLSPDELKGLEVTFTSNNKETKKQFAINASSTVNYAVSEVAE